MSHAGDLSERFKSLSKDQRLVVLRVQNRPAEERASPSTVHGGNQVGQQMVASLRRLDDLAVRDRAWP